MLRFSSFCGCESPLSGAVRWSPHARALPFFLFRVSSGCKYTTFLSSAKCFLPGKRHLPASFSPICPSFSRLRPLPDWESAALVGEIIFLSWKNILRHFGRRLLVADGIRFLGGMNPFGRCQKQYATHSKAFLSVGVSLFPQPKTGFSCLAERRFVFGFKSFCVWWKVVVSFAESPFVFRRKPLLLARKPFFSSKKNRSGANEMHFMGGIPDFMLNFAG